MRSNSSKIMMVIILSMIFLIIFTQYSFANSEEVKAYTVNTWQNRIYYMACLSGPGAPYNDIQVYITAVDEYKLYINGDFIGSDNNYQTVEQYNVNINSNEILIGVEVLNYGVGNGNGLTVEIQAGTYILGTTTEQRRSQIVGESRVVFPVKWYFYDSDITELLGEEWYLFTKDTFFDRSLLKKLKDVYTGTIKEHIPFIPSPDIEIITGYAGDIDNGMELGGGMKLRKIDGANIALNKPCEYDRLTDGDLVYGFQYNMNPLGDTKYIDFGTTYNVNKMVIYTGGNDPNEWVDRSARGYAVEISLDNINWIEVGVIYDIGISNANEGGFDWYAVEFPDEQARFLRYRIIQSRLDLLNIGEMMIYGSGYVKNGVYESDWIDFDEPYNFKNFQKIMWDGIAPEGTDITLQTKTGYRRADESFFESEWSTEYSEKIFPCDSPEPATAIKYRINLTTENTEVSPVFNAITIIYSDTDQPVNYAKGYITPSIIDLSPDISLEYIITYSMLPGQNIKHISISVPGFTNLDSVYVSDSNSMLKNNDYNWISTDDSLYVTFNNPIFDIEASGEDFFRLYFSPSYSLDQWVNVHEYNAILFNEGMNDGAGGINIWENNDMGSITVKAVKYADFGHDPENFQVMDISDDPRYVYLVITDDLPEDDNNGPRVYDVRVSANSDDVTDAIPCRVFKIPDILNAYRYVDGEFMDGSGKYYKNYIFNKWSPYPMPLIVEDVSGEDGSWFLAAIDSSQYSSRSLFEKSLYADITGYLSLPDPSDPFNPMGRYFAADVMKPYHDVNGTDVLIYEFLFPSGTGGFQFNVLVENDYCIDIITTRYTQFQIDEADWNELPCTEPWHNRWNVQFINKHIIHSEGNIKDYSNTEWVKARFNLDSMIDVEEIIPLSFTLDQNYPNPFNPFTTISFTIPKGGKTSLVIYNILGQEVRTLVAETLAQGKYSYIWDCKDNNSNTVSSGLYLYNLKTPLYTASKRMVLIK